MSKRSLLASCCIVFSILLAVSCDNPTGSGTTVAVTGVSLDKTQASVVVGQTLQLTATIAPTDATNAKVSWSSSDAAIATVSDAGLVSGVKAGSATITVTTSDGAKTATCALTVTLPAVTGVSLNKSSTSLLVGGTETLVATVTPSNAADTSVTWATSDSSVATVSKSGLVTGVKAGTTKITVTTTDGGKTATCTVTVSAVSIAVTGMTLNKNSTVLLTTKTETLYPIITPANATNQVVTWSSDKPSVATVSDSGVVTGVADGTATITAKTADGGFSQTVSVTVSSTAVSVIGVSLNKSATTIVAGGSELLVATISPILATNQSLSWSSSDESVATVTSAGLVSGVKAGSAKITVVTAENSRVASCDVTIGAAAVAAKGVSLNKTNTTLKVGDTEALSATIAPLDATNQSLTWSSSASTVATVSDAGVITAKAAGSATITVKTADGGYTATCNVVVATSVVSVTGISLNKTSTALVVGGSETLAATVTPGGATNQSVSWSTSAAGVATVSSTGLVSGVSAGTATITATTADGGYSANCTVTVSSSTVPVDNVALNLAAATIGIGGSAQLTATINPTTATNQNVTWASDTPTVASVSSSGLVSGIAAGTATITVTTADGGKTATCTVTVSSSGGDVTITVK